MQAAAKQRILLAWGEVFVSAANGAQPQDRFSSKRIRASGAAVKSWLLAESETGWGPAGMDLVGSRLGCDLGPTLRSDGNFFSVAMRN